MQDINTTLKEPKTERGRSRRQLFRHYCGSSVPRNGREALTKDTRFLCFRALTLNSSTYRITPYHVSQNMGSYLHLNMSKIQIIEGYRTLEFFPYIARHY